MRPYALSQRQQRIPSPEHPALTKAEQGAVQWLRERGGDGIFDNHGVVLAAGETAPVVRSTWNTLRQLGYVEFYKPSGKGRGRLRLTAKAGEVAA